ncbi:MAG: PadR family transcriptional regulator, partial [Actinomycetota bacterium]|nr:PadR family transcriptional regulator [Actinomycetota bacterium]
MSDQPPFRGRRGRGQFGGPGGQGSPGSFFGHGPRANRGDIRAAILALLAEMPMHGYQIIQQISERSGGVWTPSPGSV